MRGVAYNNYACIVPNRPRPWSHTPKLGSQRPRRWRPSDADARSPRPLSAAETAIAAGPFAEGVLSTARRGACRLSDRALSSHQVAVTAAVQANFWDLDRCARPPVDSPPEGCRRRVGFG